MASKEFTEAEKLAYTYLFKERYDARTAATKLTERGFPTTTIQMQRFKKRLFDQMDRDMRQERMYENMLVSFDRVKIEFEWCVKRVKKLITKFEKEGDSMKVMYANDRLAKLIETSLMVLGKLKNAQATVNMQKVNILNTADFSDAFRKMTHNWFESMMVHEDGGRLIFEKPSPEILDEFRKWQDSRFKKKVLESAVR